MIFLRTLFWSNNYKKGFKLCLITFNAKPINTQYIFLTTLRRLNFRIFFWLRFTSRRSQRSTTTPISLLLAHNDLPQIKTKIIEADLLPVHKDGTLKAFWGRAQEFCKMSSLEWLNYFESYCNFFLSDILRP